MSKMERRDFTDPWRRFGAYIGVLIWYGVTGVLPYYIAVWWFYPLIFVTPVFTYLSLRAVWVVTEDIKSDRIRIFGNG